MGPLAQLVVLCWTCVELQVHHRAAGSLRLFILSSSRGRGILSDKGPNVLWLIFFLAHFKIDHLENTKTFCECVCGCVGVGLWPNDLLHGAFCVPLGLHSCTCGSRTLLCTCMNVYKYEPWHLFYSHKEPLLGVALSPSGAQCWFFIHFLLDSLKIAVVWQKWLMVTN